MRGLVGTLCVALTIASGATVYAQPHGGGGGGGRGGGGRGEPAFRPAPIRAAAPIAPRAPSGPPGGGFQLNRDLAPGPQTQPRIARPQPAAPFVRPQPPPVAQNPRPVLQPGGRPNGAQIAVRNNPPRQRPGNPGVPRRIGNPAFHGSAWGWNRGVAWRPAPTYWGGGFWGALAFSSGAALFGELSLADQTYDSYEVYPDSPGATLLDNYQLIQTPCGPPGLVVIWGPDNSVICAYPNGTVGPGEYDIDPSTLTLVSE
jgi:hypothetical protein